MCLLAIRVVANHCWPGGPTPAEDLSAWSLAVMRYGVRACVCTALVAGLASPVYGTFSAAACAGEAARMTGAAAKTKRRRRRCSMAVLLLERDRYARIIT